LLFYDRVTNQILFFYVTFTGKKAPLSDNEFKEYLKKAQQKKASEPVGSSQIPQGGVETQKCKQADLKDNNDSPSETVSINAVPLQSIPSLPSINSPRKKKMIPSESDLSDVQKDHQGEIKVSSLWDMRFSTSAMVKDHLSFPKDLSTA